MKRTGEIQRNYCQPKTYDYNQLKDSRLFTAGILYRFEIFVSTCRAAKVVGLSLDNTLNSLFFGQVRLAVRVLDHHVIHRGRGNLFRRSCGGSTRKCPFLKNPVPEINQKAENQESHRYSVTLFPPSSRLDRRDCIVCPITGCTSSGARLQRGLSTNRLWCSLGCGICSSSVRRMESS